MHSYYPAPRGRLSSRVPFAGVCCCLLLLLASAAPARGTPAFSRQLALRCGDCHTVAPQLNLLGERFRELGYRLGNGNTPAPDREKRRKFLEESPADLKLAARLLGRSPVSFKWTADLRHGSREDPRTRFFWDELLLNLSGRSGRFSYYVHQHLHKGGHEGKEPYAGWVQANDLLRVGSSRTHLQAGLFELELALTPHFARVSTVPYLPYAYVIGPGDNFSLGEPELGLQLRGRAENWRYALAAVTGSGLRNENNDAKDLYLRIDNDGYDPSFGLFAYTGKRELTRRGREYQNEVLRIGLDSRWRPRRMKRLHLFGVLVWGSDDRVFTAGRFRDVDSFAGMLGADHQLHPRMLFHGRLEWLRTNLPDGRQDQLRSVAGIHWLARENLRLTLEAAFTANRTAPDETRLFLGGLWAF
jgi:hypothetical protein